MTNYHIDITLNEDVIFSEKAATLGGHQSLDYIPGAALLGACANKLYGELDNTKEAYTIFHSGKVRFGNGYPRVDSGKPAYPIPLSMHREKGTTEKKIVYNFLWEKLEENRQPEQVRTGYIAEDGSYVKPKTTLRMKTAINPYSGRAATGQLFGYQAIEAGQCYRATLEIDDDANIDDSLNLILDRFNSSIFLGRSRSAQYGEATASVSQNSASLPVQDDGKNLFLWFLSDMALQNEWGVMPHANQMLIPGLPPGKIIWEKSYLRYRRYSPYNSHRRCYEMERHVIVQGSVLAYEAEQDFDEKSLKDLQNKGLGLYRESGLGQVSANHPLIMKNSGVVFKEADIKTATSAPEKKPDNPLISWLETRSTTNVAASQDIRKAEQRFKQLEKMYPDARDYLGEAVGVRVGPSSSQWGRVEEQGVLYQQNRGELFKVLFDSKSAICKGSRQDWEATVFIDGQSQTFVGWLKHVLEDEALNNPGNTAAIIARNAAKIAKKQESKRSS